MGKADRLKVSKGVRNESLDQQINRTEFAQAKGRVKVHAETPKFPYILRILICNNILAHYLYFRVMCWCLSWSQVRGRKDGEDNFVGDKLSAEILKQARMQQKEMEEEHGVPSAPARVSILKELRWDRNGNDSVFCDFRQKLYHLGITKLTNLTKTTARVLVTWKIFQNSMKIL